MKNDDDTGELIGAVLIGMAIGGVLGVLFAPDKGSETRKKLMGTISDLTENIKSKMEPDPENSPVSEAESV